MHKKITIVIPTRNARHYLPDCLESVYRQRYPRELTQIVVVDNNSSDSTVDYIKEKYAGIKIIENRKNLGFAEANNQGYFLAQKNHSDYLVLLNQDTIVEPNWLNHLMALASSDKKIAMVQPKILLYPEKQLINSFGNSIHFLGFAYCNRCWEKDQQGMMQPFELPYASGAACLIKMSALDRTGLFNERLFAYHEDVDLGWRLRLAGYKILFDSSATIYHKYIFNKGRYKYYYTERNRWIIMLQNYKLATLLLLAPALVLMELGMLFYAFKNGWLKEKIKGYLWLIAHLPSISSRRLETQYKIRNRKIKDAEILRLFVGSIKFQEVKYPALTYIVNPLMEIYFFFARLIIFW